MNSEHFEPPEEEQAAGSFELESTHDQGRSVSPVLPEISPTAEFDLSSIIGESDPEAAKVKKRASNVMKLAQENEKLNAELKAMAERLEAAEKRSKELAKKRVASKTVESSEPEGKRFEG